MGLIAMTLGQRLRGLREARGWSQEDVARKMHVSVALIGRYEREERTPPWDKLNALAKLYDTDMAYLLDADVQPIDPPFEQATPDQRLRQLGVYLRGCGATEEDLEVILGLISERMKESDRIKEARQRISDTKKLIQNKNKKN
jgi:transcriptional regulator with XRE-family HTH domain